MTEPDDVTKSDLDDAVVFARQRLDRAESAYRVGGKTLLLLRAKMVAEDELKALLAERRQFEADRDVSSIRRLDCRGCRGSR